MRSPLSPLLIPLALISILGCEGAPDDPDALSGDASADPLRQSRYGLILLHREARGGLALSGQIIDSSGLDRGQALAAVAPAEYVWLAQDPPGDPGQLGCSLERLSPIAVADHPEARLDLLDVGPIQLTQQGATLLTAGPRRLPATLPALEGVVYDATLERPPQRPLAEYQIHASGDDVGPLDGWVPEAAPIRLLDLERTEAGLEVEISGPGRAQLLLVRAEGSDTVGLRCTLPHGGRHLLTAAHLSGLGEGGVRLTVARLAQGSVEIEGVPMSELMFISTDVA